MEVQSQNKNLRGMTSPGTDGKRRRTAGQKEATNSLVKAGEQAGDTDAAFMNDCFKSSPALATYLKSMWENVSLKMALARHLGGKNLSTNKVGEKFSEGVFNVGHLPKPFVWELVFAAIEAQNGAASVDGQGWVMSDSHAFSTLQYALQANRKTRLHYDATYFPEFEGSMKLVLVEHMRLAGNLLEGMTPEHTNDWGFFRNPNPLQPRKVTSPFFPDLEVTVPIADEVWDENDDWAIVDNFTHDARLYSKQADTGVGLVHLFFKRHGVRLPPLGATPLSHPSAADGLRGESEPPGESLKTGPAAGALIAAQGKTKAKAKALAPSRPKKQKPAEEGGSPPAPATPVPARSPVSPPAGAAAAVGEGEDEETES